MTEPQLADRMLIALAESERLDRRPVLRSAELQARLATAIEDVRSALQAPATKGLNRFPPAFVVGDAVILQPDGRTRLGPPADEADHPARRPAADAS